MTEQFGVRANDRFMGLVSDLDLGDNALTARLPDGRGALVTVTNHPKGGPVFSGPQVQPWICETESQGLGPPQDEQCNVDAVYEYHYMPATGGTFRDYDPEDPPPDALVASTTTDEGETMPYIVRVERGVIDRGFYEIAVLFDPDKSWEPWAPQRGWNGKVVWPFGSGGEPAHRQIAPPNVLHDQALSRGFAVATTAMAHNSQGFNDVVQAEGVMMVKEHLVENYGEIRYTIGTGCSGGSMSQYSLAANYPGLLDGIMPACGYPDVLTTYTWFGDCKLLHRYFTETSPHLWTEPQRRAVVGHAGPATCAIASVRSDSYNSPTGGSNCAEFDWSYDPETNPAGERCSVPDYAVSVYGERPPEVWTDIEKEIGRGFAQRPYDTVGIQWGLEALAGGEILPEQFVDLNEKIGGLDIDANFQPRRSRGDPGGIEVAYRSGRFTHGRELAKVPYIELRGSSNFEWHHDVQSIWMRNRLIRDNGHAKNMVYWKSPGPLLPDPVMSEEALLLIDRWLAAIEADSSDASLETKVLRNKPVDAVDACWFGGQKVTDRNICRTALPHFSEPRAEAGQPLTGRLAKCNLKPLKRENYDFMDVPFTDDQWERLEAVFPQGVCDYSEDGMFQQPPDGSWMTFEDGPGGRPLGEPPASVSLLVRAVDDPCPDGRVPEDGFGDVGGSVHESAVDCVVWWRVARGIGEGSYSPARRVTRAQMASFLANLIVRSDGRLADAPANHFGDDDGSSHHANINRLAEADIVSGTGDDSYSPGDPVTRAQMATFLVRAYRYRTGSQLQASRDYFADDDGTLHEDNINRVAEAGFTGGARDGGYQPGRFVDRAPMASFLVRVLDLLVEDGHASPSG